MLGEFRKHSKSVIIYVLFAIIIVVFVFTFNMGRGQKNNTPGMKGDGKGNAALVQVGDTAIDVMALEMGLRLTIDPPEPGRTPSMETIRAQYMYMSTRFTDFRGEPRFAAFIQDPRKVSPVKSRKVMDDLIETWLVSEEAAKNGLVAGPDEIRDRILARFSDPSSGEFKRKTYENWVRYRLRSSIGRFEEFVGREIAREKMIGLVTAGVSVPEREARYVAAQRKSMRSYDFVEISQPLLAAAIVSDPAEVTAWLAANEDKARKYFEDNKAEFAVEAGLDFHVLKYADEAKANAALETLKGKTGTDLRDAMAAMAGTESEDEVTNKIGGRSMTALTPEGIAGLYDKAVADALDGMKEYELSPVIKGARGNFIVMLDGRRPEAAPDYDRSRETIARRMLGEQKVAAESEAVAVRAIEGLKAAQGRPMEEVAAELNAAYAPHTPVRVGETGEIKGLPEDLNQMIGYDPDNIPGIGTGAAIAAELAALTPDSPVVAKAVKPEGGASLFVVRLKGFSQNEQPTAEEIASASAELAMIRRVAVWREWYQDLLARAAGSQGLVEKELLGKMINDEIRSREEAQAKSKEAAQKK